MIGFRASPADEPGLAALDAHLASYLVPNHVRCGRQRLVPLAHRLDRLKLGQLVAEPGALALGVPA